MRFSCEDFTLCNDQLVYGTDNPLGGKRNRGHTVDELTDTCSRGHAAVEQLFGAGDNLPEQVAELAASLPESPALSVSCLTLNNALVYLLGTDHVNPRCRAEVSRVIDLIKPDKVMVELCKLRACRCPQHMTSIFQNPAQFTFSYLRKVIAEIGFVSAFIFMADVFNEMRVSGNVHLEFGGEMTGAIRQARSIHRCELLLGDRPIVITIQRRASAMSWWTRLRLIAQVTLGLACRPLRASLLTNAHYAAEADAMTHYIFVFERDLCLVNALQTAAAAATAETPLKIVAVVGGGHTNGIHRYWGMMRSDIAEIIYKPEFHFKYR